MNALPPNKVKIGFFSFTEITDPAEHHSYNEWHMLDHMPEQYPLDGVAFGQRWVSTPACRSARPVSGERLDPIHYMTLYLMTEPVDRTLREFMQLGRDLHALDRFHLHRRSRLSGPFPLVGTAVAGRVLISAQAVPYRPNRGIYVQVEALDGAPDPDRGADTDEGTRLEAWCAQDGVAGAWSFADTDHRITVGWLDAPPLEVSGALDALVTGPRTIFAGPLEAIRPWEWDWFDSEAPTADRPGPGPALTR